MKRGQRRRRVGYYAHRCFPTIGDVDRVNQVIALKEHKTARKTRRPRRILIGRKFGELLDQEIGDRTEGPVFLSPRGKQWKVANRSGTYSRLRDLAGLTRDLVLYLARHECGTKICRKKGIEYTRRLLGQQADLKHMIAHAFRGAPFDPEVARRVRERAEKVREEVRASGVRMKMPSISSAKPAKNYEARPGRMRGHLDPPPKRALLRPIVSRSHRTRLMVSTAVTQRQGKHKELLPNEKQLPAERKRAVAILFEIGTTRRLLNFSGWRLRGWEPGVRRTINDGMATP
jgi:hypothetical protein